MTLSRQNAALSQVINVGDNAIGDTILIPSGNVVDLNGILTAVSGNFSSLTVNNNPVYHSGILPNPVTGTGTANHIPYWSSTSGLLADSNQLIWDASNNRLGIGTSTPSGLLDVNGNANINGILSISGVPLAEIIDGEVAGLLVAGSGLNLNYNDSINTLTISTNRNITNSSRLFLWTNFR